VDGVGMTLGLASRLGLAVAASLFREHFGVQSLQSQVPCAQHVMNLPALNLADRRLGNAGAFLDLKLRQALRAEGLDVLKWGGWPSHSRLFYRGVADYASTI
jgi:hypothetical protein